MMAALVMLTLAATGARRSFGGRKVTWEDSVQSNAGIMAGAVAAIRDLQSSFGRTRHPVLPLTAGPNTPLLDYCATNNFKVKRDSSSDGEGDDRWGSRHREGSQASGGFSSSGGRGQADLEGAGQRGSYVAMRPARNLSKNGNF